MRKQQCHDARGHRPSVERLIALVDRAVACHNGGGEARRFRRLVYARREMPCASCEHMLWIHLSGHFAQFRLLQIPSRHSHFTTYPPLPPLAGRRQHCRHLPVLGAATDDPDRAM